MQTQSKDQIEENGYRNGPYFSEVTEAILPPNFLEISKPQNMSNCNSIRGAARCQPNTSLLR